jgi:sensor histidine kinase YesM
MHPILGDRRRLALYLLAWFPVALLLAVGLRRDVGWLPALLFFLPLCLAYAFITLSSWYVCRVFPLDSRTTTSGTLTVVHVLAGVLVSAVWVGMAGAWSRTIDFFGGGRDAGGLFEEQQLTLFAIGALLFWMAAAVHYLLIAFEASREAETRALELNLLAREAELKALRAQIDPHFIFNSLHSISALTASDPAAARRMCILLADFLRDTLRLGANRHIPLADEFALAERFLAIEQIRLGPRLHITRETDDEATACLVPPLLLQPLVENAVVHGVAQLVDGGTIRMAASRVGPTLTITLENPCDPDRARTRGVGLGLDLLRKRLANQFGALDAVQAAEREGSFRVEVRIPAVTAA